MTCPLCTDGWQRIILQLALHDSGSPAEPFGSTDILSACTCDAGLQRAAQGVAPAWMVLDRHPTARAAYGQPRPNRHHARYLDGWREVCRVRGIPVPAWIQRAEVIPSATTPEPAPIPRTVSIEDVARYNAAAIAADAVYVYPDLPADAPNADTE